MAVLSSNRQQIEGYSCKIKRDGILSEDCTNLTFLARKAEELDYNAHVGFVCFDHSHVITQKIKDRQRDIAFSIPIHAYGLDNIQELGENPF